ncbi:MAG: hypothetical protein R6U44_10010 [Archaeoglobaceae archaeon]
MILNLLFNFLKEVSENRGRYAKIVILWSILIFSTLSMIAFTETIKQHSIEPYAKAQYDYKFTSLINESVRENLLKEDYIEDIVFVLISDIKLNDKRVTAALISNIEKANLTIYNPSTLTSGSFEKGAVIVNQEIAKEMGLDVGENVVITPIHSDYQLNQKVSGIAYSTISTRIADVFIGYPEVYKEYFSSRLPMNATYGETYIKFKDSDKELYAGYANELLGSNNVISRDEKVRELSSYYEKEFGNPLALILSYSGIILFIVLLLRESTAYANRNRRVYGKLMKFGYSVRLLSQYLLNMSITIILSVMLAITYLIILSRLYPQLNFFFDTLSPVLVMIPLALVASLLIFYRTTKAEVR